MFFRWQYKAAELRQEVLVVLYFLLELKSRSEVKLATGMVLMWKGHEELF